MSDTISSLEFNFGINKDCVVVISSSRVNCLVPSGWIESNSNNVPEFIPFIPEYSYKNVSKSLASLILARTTSNQNLPGFLPVTVNIIRKKSKVVESLIDRKLSISSSKHQLIDISNAQARSHVQHLQEKCMLKEARETYSNAFHTGNIPKRKLLTREHNELVKEVVKRLYGREPVYSEKFYRSCSLSAYSSDYGRSKESIERKSNSRFVCSHPSLHPVYFIAETGSAYYAFQPFVRYTLADLVVLSPLKLSENICKMFAITEIFMAMQHLHSLGLNVANIRLSDFSVNDMLWIRIVFLNFENLFRDISTTSPSKTPMASSLISSTESSITSSTLYNLPNITQSWICGEISNLDYLMVLNKLAGRSTTEPNHHPILPWVLDFSGPSHEKAKFRNLSKSKYRLNKGDEQLDLTFDSTNPESVMSHPNQTPFHVSDFLSDISYYVYVARTTPSDVLCRIVRPRWQPNHYPVSLERLYEWTPDECIPAFYVDSEIFASCHEDLLNLQLPMWAPSNLKFIETHRAALESPEVSRNLHHWIDLTFGYKLTGVAAVESKNVCLQLVDKHKTLLNHGIVQLFQTPHPVQRSCFRKSPSFEVPRMISTNVDNRDIVHFDLDAIPVCEDDMATLSREWTGESVPSNNKMLADTLSDLSHLEQFLDFCVNETHHLDRDFGKKILLGECDADELTSSVITRDMQTLGCLLVEMFEKRPTVQLSLDSSSLQERYSLVRSLAVNHLHDFPFFIQNCLIYLLNLPPSRQRALGKSDSEMGSAFTYPSINYPNELPPPTIDLLLASYTGVLHLPSYIGLLYRCISACQPLIPNSCLPVFIEPHGVSALSSFTRRFSYFECTKDNEVISSILLPYVQYLVQGSQGKEVAINASWSLFYSTSKCLNSEQAVKALLSPMLNLFSLDETTQSFLKIYHRSFVSQLITVFKLNVFLKNFATLLVEAVSGFKNFPEFESYESPLKSIDVIEESVFNEEVSSPKNQKLVEQDESIEVDELYETCCPDMLLFEPDNDVEPDDTKSSKSDGISMASVEEDESSLRSDAGIQLPLDASNPDNPSSFEGASSFSPSNSNLNNQSSPSNSNLNNQFSFPNDSSHLTETNPKKSSVNISTVASETVKWLSEKIGPVLTARYLSRNLLRMLVICYIPPQQLEVIDTPPSNLQFEAFATRKYVSGDLNAKHVADCLLHIVCEYGEQILLIQYLQHVKELVGYVETQKTLNTKCEGYLMSSVTIMLIIVPHLSINLLIDSLQTITNDVLFPILDLLSSKEINFFTTTPSSRNLIAFRMVDVIATISIRLGFEMTRFNIMHLIKKFFDGFKSVEDEIFEEVYHDAADGSSETTPQLTPNEVRYQRQESLRSLFEETPESLQCPVNEAEEENAKFLIEKQLKETYTSELAHVAYVTFCKLAGGICMEQHLDNDDFIRKMCSNHDQMQSFTDLHGRQVKKSDRTSYETAIEIPSRPFNSFNNNEEEEEGISIEGNKIIVRSLSSTPQTRYSSSLMASAMKFNEQQTNIADSTKSNRHLRGDWLSYWEHEVGLSDRQQLLNIKQIKLQTFKGHTSAVRDMVVMNCENSFISSSKDHTVKLWSLRNQEGGSAIIPHQSSYNQHRKSISSLVYVEPLKMVASSDGHVHIWDPFNMTVVKRVTSLKFSPISILACAAPPSSLILAASNDSIVRLIDSRMAKFSHYLKTSTIPAGLIRSLAVSDDGQHVAVGFSSGIITTMDLRTGGHISSWKAYDSEIYELKIINNKSIIAASLDTGLNIWSFPSGKLLYSLKGTSENTHWFNYWNGSLVFGNFSNRIIVQPSINPSSQVEWSCIKLKSDLLKGNMSCLSLLPLNHLLLLASDHGDITLVA